MSLQTNSSGGKTNSMAALYHLFGDKDRGHLPGTEDLIREVGMSQPVQVKRAVLVGNKITLVNGL